MKGRVEKLLTLGKTTVGHIPILHAERKNTPIRHLRMVGCSFDTTFHIKCNQFLSRHCLRLWNSLPDD